MVSPPPPLFPKKNTSLLALGKTQYTRTPPLLIDFSLLNGEKENQSTILTTILVFLCAIVLYWVTNKEPLGSAYTRNRPPRRRQQQRIGGGGGSTPTPLGHLSWRPAARRSKDTSGSSSSCRHHRPHNQQDGPAAGGSWYCGSLDCSTLAGGPSSIPLPPSVASPTASPTSPTSGLFGDETMTTTTMVMTDPHPGSLIPGSIYLGASRERVVEDDDDDDSGEVGHQQEEEEEDDDDDDGLGGRHHLQWRTEQLPPRAAATTGLGD